MANKKSRVGDRVIAIDGCSEFYQAGAGGVVVRRFGGGVDVRFDRGKFLHDTPRTMNQNVWYIVWGNYRVTKRRKR